MISHVAFVLYNTTCIPIFSALDLQVGTARPIYSYSQCAVFLFLFFFSFFLFCIWGEKKKRIQHRVLKLEKAHHFPPTIILGNRSSPKRTSDPAPVAILGNHIGRATRPPAALADSLICLSFPLLSHFPCDIMSQKVSKLPSDKAFYSTLYLVFFSSSNRCPGSVSIAPDCPCRDPGWPCSPTLRPTHVAPKYAHYFPCPLLSLLPRSIDYCVILYPALPLLHMAHKLPSWRTGLPPISPL